MRPLYRRCLWPFVLALVLSILGPLEPQAEPQARLSKGQIVYVPAYSHIYSGDREHALLLTVTVSIRNVDLKHPITITKVAYYETQGKFLRDYMDKPAELKPLESTRFIVPQRDKAGGSGANFIVEWHADEKVNAPIIESVMIGAQNQQGISFTSRGQVLHVLP